MRASSVNSLFVKPKYNFAQRKEISSFRPSVTQLNFKSQFQISPSPKLPLFYRHQLFLSAKPTHLSFKRFAEIDGGEVTKGDYIIRKGKRCLVVSNTKVRTGGRGASYNSVELKEVDSGKKFNERLRVSETVTKLECRGIKGTVTEIIKDEKAKPNQMKGIVKVTANVTEEEIDVPLEKLPSPSVYYIRVGDAIQLHYLIKEDEEGEEESEELMSASLPYSATCQVKSFEGNGLLLDNGRILKGQVPDHVKEGDYVSVNRDDETYITKLANQPR